MKEHIVRLTDEDKLALLDLVRSGIRPVRVVLRAQVLLKSDAGLTDLQILEHTGVSVRAITRIRRKYCVDGLERALFDAPRSGAPARFSTKQRQQVIALACTDPPQGYARWTLKLLCREAVDRGFVESLSKSRLAVWLEEHDLKPWRKKVGASPS